jgi:DUF971 family protein
MGCGGDREKGAVSMEERWDYVVRIQFDKGSDSGYSY